MWREDFIEKESEKRTWLKEDRRFVDEMKQSVHMENGHYVLPLPLRKETTAVEDEDDRNPNRNELLRLVHNSTACENEGHGEGRTETDDAAATTDIRFSKEINTGLSSNKKEVKIVDTKVSANSSENKSSVTEYLVIPDNRGQVMQRLRYTKRKLIREKKMYDEYCGFMHKLLAAGHARKVPKERLKERAWYLPHHGVYLPTKKK